MNLALCISPGNWPVETLASPYPQELIYSIVTEDDIASLPACEVHSCEVTTDDSPKSDMPSPPDEDLHNVTEPYPGFHAQVIQLLSEADALVNAIS